MSPTRMIPLVVPTLGPPCDSSTQMKDFSVWPLINLSPIQVVLDPRPRNFQPFDFAWLLSWSWFRWIWKYTLYLNLHQSVGTRPSSQVDPIGLLHMISMGDIARKSGPYVDTHVYVCLCVLRIFHWARGFEQQPLVRTLWDQTLNLFPLTTSCEMPAGPIWHRSGLCWQLVVTSKHFYRWFWGVHISIILDPWRHPTDHGPFRPCCSSSFRCVPLSPRKSVGIFV